MQNQQSKSVAVHDEYAAAPGAAIAEVDRPVPPLARPVRDGLTVDAPASMWDTAPGPARGLDGTTELRYASFGARVGAAVLDAVILQVASVFVESMFLGMLLSSLNATTLLATMMGTVVLNGAFAVFYCVWLESSAWQATPGKRIMGLKVVDLEGRRIGFGRSSWRNMAKTLSVLTLGMGYLMPLWSMRKQTLHDKAASCLVIRAA